MNDELDGNNRVENNDLQAGIRPNLLGVCTLLYPIFWVFSIFSGFPLPGRSAPAVGKRIGVWACRRVGV
jgi:hypothetical protein